MCRVLILSNLSPPHNHCPVAASTPFQVLPIAGEEEVTSVIPIDKFNDDEHLVLLTSHGVMKKTPLKAFKTITSRGLIIITLGADDSLKWARRCKLDEEVLIATKDGFATRFAAVELSSTGRQSRGVRAITLRDNDEMADMDILRTANKSQFRCKVLLRKCKFAV